MSIQIMRSLILFKYILILQISDEYAPISLLCGFGGERPPIETRSNVMYVHFISNNYLTAAGFNLTFEAVRSKYDPVMRFLLQMRPANVIVSLHIHTDSLDPIPSCSRTRGIETDERS